MRAKASSVLRQALINSSTSVPCGLNLLNLESDLVDLNAIAPCLSRLPKLQSLRIRRVTVRSKTMIMESGFHAIFQALVSSNVSSLDIAHNAFTDKDKNAFNTLVAKSTTLTHICVGDVVGLDVQGMLNSLQNNPNTENLELLDLSWLDLSAVVPSLVQLISSSKHLSLLVLDATNISPSQVIEVVGAVVRNVHLKNICLGLRDLNLGSNRSALSAFAELFDIGRDQNFSNVAWIKELHLDRNGLGISGLHRMIDSLSGYPPIETFSCDEVSLCV
jgi:hypothetical protein